jgi:hypothetical protein
MKIKELKYNLVYSDVICDSLNYIRFLELRLDMDNSISYKVLMNLWIPASHTNGRNIIDNELKEIYEVK